jgi:AraC-like DNA-binding protein
MKSVIKNSDKQFELTNFQHLLGSLLGLMVLHVILLLLKVDIVLSFLYGPLIYCYTNNKRDLSLNPSNNMKSHLLFAAGAIVISSFLNDFTKGIFFASQAFAYSYAIYQRINDGNKREYSNLVFNYISIMSILLFTNASIVTIIELTNFFKFQPFVQVDVLAVVGAMLYVIFTAISLNEYSKKLERLEAVVMAFEEEEEDIIINKVALTQKEVIEKLAIFFEEEEVYLDPNFTLDRLAHHIGVEREIVSEVLNHNMNLNYYQVLAKYRIEHAKKVMGKEKNLTIDAIMEECGFSSKSSFNKYFKQFVGTTPSVYRNSLEII